MWRKTLIGLALVAGLAALRFLPAGKRPDEPEQSLKVQRPLMGTVWGMEVMHRGSADGAQKAVDAAFVELERIDRLMSEWKPDSPISQVNQAAGKQPVEVPEELRAMLERSVRYSELSHGAFDVTWRGMGRIWHFDDNFAVPSKADVEKARRNVGYRDLRIEGNRVFLPRPEMSIGLGGIAKGYAVDRAAAVLEKAGFHDYLVDGGGDIRVSGKKQGQPWSLGIQHPREPRGTLIGRVRLTSGVLVSSGDYERFRMVDGVRYHHIIDVRTGYPAMACQGVSVIAAEAEKAVVMGKVVFILGPEEGMRIAQAEGVEVLAIDAAGKRHASAGFLKVLEE
ncbi:MAG: FAD:protein FMN transferase [Acidobacteria bacterium]|nr:FAD:protein FMN transferase [Acidobacteriota bacterium]